MTRNEVVNNSYKQIQSRGPKLFIFTFVSREEKQERDTGVSRRETPVSQTANMRAFFLPIYIYVNKIYSYINKINI